MGKVAVEVKVFVDENEDVNAVQQRIAQQFNTLSEIKKEELGFGIVFLKALFVVEDEGGSDDIEEKLRNVPGVKNVEVVGVTLV
jgi:translation elongation factor EF-1beta